MDSPTAVPLALCLSPLEPERLGGQPCTKGSCLQSPREEDRKQGIHLGGWPLTHQKEARPEGGLLGAGPP